MTELTKLFEPGNIGKMEVKNRIVMAPAGTGAHGPEGQLTDKVIDYCEKNNVSVNLKALFSSSAVAVGE